MAAPVSGIFWLHFCPKWGSGDTSSIFIYTLWSIAIALLWLVSDSFPFYWYLMFPMCARDTASESSKHSTTVNLASPCAAETFLLLSVIRWNPLSVSAQRFFFSLLFPPLWPIQHHGNIFRALLHVLLFLSPGPTPLVRTGSHILIDFHMLNKCLWGRFHTKSVKWFLLFFPWLEATSAECALVLSNGDRQWEDTEG